MKAFQLLLVAMRDQNIVPSWDTTRDEAKAPHCSVKCPSSDGKRCKKLGHRPAIMCQPAVEILYQFAEAKEIKVTIP